LWGQSSKKKSVQEKKFEREESKNKKKDDNNNNNNNNNMSSLGYAQRLAWKEDVGGTLGSEEIHFESERVEQLAKELADVIREAGKIDDDDTKKKKKKKTGVIVHTGAGISTAAGIPDFRGPKGIWTLQKAGENLPTSSVPFPLASPTVTHMVLCGLHKAGYIRYVVSCNVDGLHYRSGIPREEVGELHGNCFAERCETCECEYFRDFEMESVGFKYTGRRCRRKECAGKLRDQVLDWDDALPEPELCRAENEAKKAKLALVLGSSLQIVPSGDLPLLTIPDARYKKRKRSSLSSSGGKNKKPVTRKTTGGQLAIVNLQATEKDQFADLVVHAKTDQVMLQVAKYLNIEIPDYVRKDAFGVRYVAHASNEDNEDKRIHLKVQIVSQHFESDHDIPVPWLEDIDVKSIPKWVKVKNLEQETKRVGGLFVCKTFEFMRMFSDFLNDDDDDEEIVFEIKPNARLNSSPTISTTRSSRALQRLLERVTKGEKLTLSICEESETIDNIETHVVRYQQKR
jgi:mono-ADP-ribosyltransferase sirtuin 6